MKHCSGAGHSVRLFALGPPAVLLIAQMPGCPVIGPDRLGPICKTTGSCACQEDADCDDGRFCTGIEACGSDGRCVGGTRPCGWDAARCDDSLDSCVSPCTKDSDCDDGMFCNGVEFCGSGGICYNSGARCSSLCNETEDRCEPCIEAEDCDDGVPCTQDVCQAGRCFHPPCSFPYTCDAEAGCVVIGDPCLSQCELGRGFNCEERPLAEFDGFETALAVWRQEPACDSSMHLSRVAGRCDDATWLLRETTGLTSQVNYYDSESGAFLALTTTTDAGFPICGHVGYWPFYFECADAVVAEVICGDQAAGDSINLP